MERLAPSPQVNSGIAFAFLAYLLFCGSDAALKIAATGLPAVEVAFFASLFAVVVLPLIRDKGERWGDLFRLSNPGLVAVRAIAGTTAGIFSVLSFKWLPFSEAYALGFLMPLFVAVMSVPLLGERIRTRTVLGLAGGLVGVLVILRPGLRDLSLGHLAAIGTAMSSAVAVIALRAIGRTERRSTIYAATLALLIVVNGPLMLLDFQPPSSADLAALATAGALGGIAQVSLIAASRAAPANRIAPAQYSQVVWSILLAVLVFGETVEVLSVAGMLLICGSGALLFDMAVGGRKS